MPFMLNGVAMNKPVQNGAVLNCLHGGSHVWLQNKLTGIANAPPSTLSKDGVVMATNLVANHEVRSGGEAANVLISDTSNSVDQ